MLTTTTFERIKQNDEKRQITCDRIEAAMQEKNINPQGATNVRSTKVGNCPTRGLAGLPLINTRSKQ